MGSQLMHIPTTRRCSLRPTQPRQTSEKKEQDRTQNTRTSHLFSAPSSLAFGNCGQFTWNKNIIFPPAFTSLISEIEQPGSSSYTCFGSAEVCRTTKLLGSARRERETERVGVCV